MIQLTGSSRVELAIPKTKPISYALDALRRDIAKTLNSKSEGCPILLRQKGLPEEQYEISSDSHALILSANDDLGFVYAIYEVSRRFLGVLPFWFWNDQTIERRDSIEIPDNLLIRSKPANIRWRGWFINDETLLSHWNCERRPEGPWEMAMEALLRLGGNLIIPGTDQNARIYRRLASDMGLVITHHHAEPLGAEMFARAYPELEPSFDAHPELFRGLWKRAIDEQSDMRVIFNIGFRGQGDKPFWDDDPRYDTDEKRGALMTRLILEQYDLIRQSCPHAVCCTNLYGETMELYQKGVLKLPADLIKIWADNGYGKMVSRRQENANPRVPALPSAADTGAQGIYYHASFYDLQAASHITMLPNSAEFVASELQDALMYGADDYWLINCSNIKPHVYVLDLIANLWQAEPLSVEAHRRKYVASYYGSDCAAEIAGNLSDYTAAAVSYGEHEDDHAGDQFYNHVPRMLLSAFMKDSASPAENLFWLRHADSLQEQVRQIHALFQTARTQYDAYLMSCEKTHAALKQPSRRLFEDSILLQATLYQLWADGASEICESLDAAFCQDFKRAFYHAGKARHAYLDANEALRKREHGKWIDFYRNECQTDVKQTAWVCGIWMSYLRNLGEGPHFYEWQREFFDSEEDRRIMLILNTENHPDDEALWRMMEQRYGC